MTTTPAAAAVEIVECSLCGSDCEHPSTMCAGCSADVSANLESRRWDRDYWHEAAVKARRADLKDRAAAACPQCFGIGTISGGARPCPRCAGAVGIAPASGRP